MGGKVSGAGAIAEEAGRVTVARPGMTNTPIVESSASRSSAPQLRMEQEPERGQHTILSVPPAQQSMPGVRRRHDERRVKRREQREEQ